MNSFCDLKMHVPKEKNMVRYDEFGSMDSKYSANSWSKVKDGKSIWLNETEKKSPCVFPPMFYGRKLGSWQDEYSLPMFNSSSKYVSGDSVEFGKYQGFDNLASHPENHRATCDSGLEGRNSSAMTCHSSANTNTGQSDQHDDCLFELIKAQCLYDSKLMAKVIKWSTRHSNTSQISHEDIMKLSRGRIWINARVEKSNKNLQQGSSQEKTLDKLKGPYEEVELGIYKQPKADGLEGGMQHSLFKDPVGLWIIRKYDPALGIWSTAAREFPDGR